MKTKWQVRSADPDLAADLCRRIGCHPVTAQILVKRGVSTPDSARTFLSPSLSDLRPPARILDMDAAAERLCRAVIEREPILVFGDYDADGVTAAALLYGFLSECGVEVRVHLPHRLREGYGLRSGHIRRLTRSERIRLVVTVDCGSASHRALAAAAAAGIEVIVTDHHRISDGVPEAAAVVNPSRPDCPSDLALLSGVGIAFYLVIALRQRLRAAGFWSGRREPNLKAYCDLVAIGTVADMVPLRKENRILVRAGLSVLNSRARPGLAHLMAASGVEGRPVDAQVLAYRLAPRINAAGRMAHAMAAFRLLTAADDRTAQRIAALLDRLNGRRQQTEARVLTEALQMLEERPETADRRTAVLFRPDWPEGVLGIVASRLIRRMGKPVVLISTRSGIGKGSARSVPGIDLHEALARISDEMLRFGGHAMAAGLSVSPERIERFADRFEETIARAPARPTEDAAAVDAVIRLSDISEKLMEEFDQVGPFGEGNPEPLLMARSVRVVSSSPAGGAHLKMALRQDGDPEGRVLEAIRFGAGTRKPAPVAGWLVFRLQWNYWRGRRRLQLVVLDLEEKR